DGDPARHIHLNDVLAFAVYDDAGRADLGRGVVVERAQLARNGESQAGWRLLDNGRLLAEVEDVEPVPAHPLPTGEPTTTLVPASFTPPPFGLTVLGSSHGFDPAG